MNDNWEKWASSNAHKINDGFERDFVNIVLSEIKKINPDDVCAQYTFKDSIGKFRRIDFLIKNVNKGYFLAIELDGARRGNNETQAQWSDFLQRQNDLLELVGPLLRFSNSQMFKNARNVIHRIEKTLVEQEKQFHSHNALLSEYKAKENRLNELENILYSSNNEIFRLKSISTSQNEYKELERELISTKNKYEVQLQLVESAKIEITDDKSRNLEYALNESEIKIQNITKEKRLMLKTMLVISLVVVVSMLVIVSRTGISNVNHTSVENRQHTEIIPNENLQVSYQPKMKSERIPAYKSAFYIGKSIMACGILVEIKNLSNRTYLNLDKKYPSQSLTILIWNNNLKKFKRKFGSLESLINRELCVYGTIEEYKNNLQIKVSNENFLRLMR